MSNFPGLEQVLHAWVNEASRHLTHGDHAAVIIDPRRWQRDSDGIFRFRERQTRVWPHDEFDALRQLPTWDAVDRVLHEDDRLRMHLNQLVGTEQGGWRFDVHTICHWVLPSPDESEDLWFAFSRRYAELDQFLSAQEIEYVVVWPLRGLTSDQFPVALESGLEIDAMSDKELAAVLDTGVLRLFMSAEILFPEQERDTSCLRYHLQLPKVIGDRSDRVPGDYLAREEVITDARDTFEQALALIFVDPVAVSGRAMLARGPEPGGRGVSFEPESLTPALRFRRTHLDAKASAEMVRVWQLLRHPGLLKQKKALALALRRLAYHAQRQRVEDEIVDILVAAEALYLSDVGPTTELGFRLALRAAALSDGEKLSLSQREVFDLMRSAYTVRSTIVHGDSPKAKDLKVKNVQVGLPEFVEAVERVVRQALHEALDRATSQSSSWPPDWDGLTLPR